MRLVPKKECASAVVSQQYLLKGKSLKGSAPVGAGINGGIPISKKANYEFTCVRCHKTFTAYGNKGRKYCCHECYVADRYYGGI